MKSKAVRHLAAYLALFCLTIAATVDSARAQEASPATSESAEEGLIEMNFRNVEIGNFLSIMSRAFDVPFVWDAGAVKGQINLESFRKYSPEDAYKLFETVLAMHGYTMIEAEGSPVVRVVPMKDAARQPTPINPDPDAARGGNVFVTRIFVLKYADPAALLAALAPLMSKTAAVAAYAPANALILSDIEENLRRVQKIIEFMDVEPGEADLVVIPLKYASAKKLAPLLTSLAKEVRSAKPARGKQAPAGARKSIIVAEERTNSLVISADPGDITQFRKLIEALDIPGAVAYSGFKIYRLQYAQAADLAKILGEVKRSAPTPPARAGKKNAAATLAANVVITADRPTNSLIVFAPPEMIETFDLLVKELDVPGRAVPADFKIYRLQYAEAANLAKILSDVNRATSAPAARAQKKAQPAPGERQSVVITADRATNSLIVFAPAEVIETFDQIVAELDVPGRAEAADFKIYRLQYAEATNLAKILSDVNRATSAPAARAQKKAQPATGQQQAVVITADRPTNSLIVFAPAEVIETFDQIVAELDVPGRAKPADFKIYQLRYASAAEMAKIFQQVRQGTAKGGVSKAKEAATTRPVEIVVIADRPTNSVIVFAPSEVMNTFDRLVEVLDVAGRVEGVDFKVYKLKYSSAEELAGILKEIKTAPGDGKRDPKSRAAVGEQKILLITADKSTNSLIVFAPPEMIEIFDQIVAALDIPGRAEEAFFKFYKLQYASAKELATILQDVKIVADRTPGAGAKGGKPTAGKTVTLVTADEPTNTLIVFGSPQLIETMDSLVAALDIPERIQPSTFKIYRLEHASAEDLAAVLLDVKKGAEETGTQPQTRTSTTKGTTPAGLTISADKATNTVIVFGPPEIIATMDEIVAALDVRRKQVFVEMLIMEVTLEKSLTLGINWQANTKVGDAVIGGGFPNATPQDLEGSLAGGQGAVLGIVGDQIQFQGQSFVSFSAFIQATRQDQDLNILANPQILTLDNEEAEINVTQVIPVSSKVVRDVNNLTTTEFEFKDVGIILKITPQITGTDKVLLTIDQESSSVAARQVVTGGDQTAITTLKRTIKTKVLIDNGATIAIGGLIQDQEILTVTKVPCLGDIPVLGWFFKSRSEEVRKTNLIVFLRPHIINTREDLINVTRGAQYRYEGAKEVRTDTEQMLREDFELAPERKYTPPEEDLPADEESQSAEEPEFAE